MPDYDAIMKECVLRAQNAEGFTATNPLVGAAIIKNGSVLSYGIHEYFGGAHAEINALKNLGEPADGAELLVTLEPCSKFGKTPPCVDAVINSGIKKVFIGVTDPNPDNAMTGVRKLREAGIETTVGVASYECALLIEKFTKSIKTKKPYVTLKIGMSADGKIATKTGDSKWITSEYSRQKVSDMREKAGAVLVGVGTVLADDPMLIVRKEHAKRHPVRVVLDGGCKIPVDSNLVETARDYKTIVFTSESADKTKIEALRDKGLEVETAPIFKGALDLDYVLKKLYSKNIMDVLVEGGSSIFGSFCDMGEVDMFNIFIAPKIIGSQQALSSVGGEGRAFMSEVREFASMSAESSDIDILIKARVKDYTKDVLKSTEEALKG